MSVVQEVWRFAVGFNVVGALGSMSAALDRLMMSKLLPVEMLGYYSIAGTPAGALTLLGSSCGSAVYPAYNHFLAIGDRAGLSRAYLDVTRFVARLTVPASMCLLFFGHELLALWLSDGALAGRLYVCTTLLAGGCMVNATNNTAYLLTIASGNTRLPLKVNAVTLVAAAPALLYGLPKWGFNFAAAWWLAQNVVWFVVYQVHVRSLLCPGAVVDVARLLLINAFVAFLSFLLAKSAALLLHPPLPLMMGLVAMAAWAFWAIREYWRPQLLLRRTAAAGCN